MLIKAIADIMDQIAPRRLAEEWDNVGLLVGNADKDTGAVLVCLDVTPEVIREAKQAGAGLIISHHPFIFHAMKKVRTDSPFGLILKELFINDIAVFTAHTNLDKTLGGVNDVLANKLGLTSVKMLKDKDDEAEAVFCRTGKLADPTLLEQFAQQVKTALNAETLRIVRGDGIFVRKVAVCGGSSAEFIEKAAKAGADVFVGGDIRYHDAQKAVSLGIAVIDAGHFATEYPVVEALAERLRSEMPAVNVLTHKAADYFSAL